MYICVLGTGASHVCGFKKNSPSCLNHHENVLDSINKKLRGDEALIVCIPFIDVTIFLFYVKKKKSIHLFWESVLVVHFRYLFILTESLANRLCLMCVCNY